MLAEAACELFLEQGFEATSITDIARRAGVGRSSFFNYTSSKSELLWVGFDARLAELPAELERQDPSSALLTAFADLAPDALALAFANVEAMGLVAELERAAALRLVRIASAISDAERGSGGDPMRADITGAAYAAAVMTALRHWSFDGPGKQPFRESLQRALDAAGGATHG